jgi:hypothetical protein
MSCTFARFRVVSGLSYLALTLAMLGCATPRQESNLHDIDGRLSSLEKEIQTLAEQQRALIDALEKGNSAILKEIAVHKQATVANEAELESLLKEAEIVEPPVKQMRRAMGEMMAISNALRSYQTDTSQYPSVEGKPYLNYAGLGFHQVTGLVSYIFPNYITRIPALDPWGSPYLYALSPKKDHFILLCTGSDKKPNDDAPVAKVLQSIDTQGFVLGQNHVVCYQSDILLYDDWWLQCPSGLVKDCSHGDKQ